MTSPASSPGCPPWCRTDHQKVLFITDGGHPVRESLHRGDRVTTAYRRHPSSPGTHVLPRQMHLEGAEPVVVVVDLGSVLSLGTDEARELAALVELLASATPGEHRKLAAAIRSASALIGTAREAGQ